MNHLSYLYCQLTACGYVSQRDYLDRVPESISRNDALLEVYNMEKQGLVMIDYTKKNPVYYLRENTQEYLN